MEHERQFHQIVDPLDSPVNERECAGHLFNSQKHRSGFKERRDEGHDGCSLEPYR